MPTSHINPSVASRAGELFRAFWSGSVPASTTYDFIVLPPAGVSVIGITRAQTVFDGRLNTMFMVGGSGYSVAETMSGYNFNEIDGDTSQSSFLRITGLTGAAARTSGAPIISDTTGPTREQSVQTVSDVQPTFNATSFPVFRYQNPGAEPVGLWIDIIWAEEG